MRRPHPITERTGGLDAEEDGLGGVLVVDGDGGGEAGGAWCRVLLLCKSVLVLSYYGTGKDELLVRGINDHKAGSVVHETKFKL